MHRLGLVALLVIAALGAGAGWLEVQISKPYRGPRPERIFIDIPHRTSRWDIAGTLKQNNVIRNRFAFELFSLWHHKKTLKAGEYLIDQEMNTRQVFWMIANGRIFVHIVVIPEGWTMYDIANELDRQGVCPHDNFLSVARDTSLISDLAPNARSLEGFLFPSTYEFTRHTSCEQVAATMVRHFHAVWETINSLDPPGQRNRPRELTLDQVVNLASLVERETPSPQERPLVAGVFYNRLRLGYPLQCDPTVQYAMELAGHPEAVVHASNLRIDSPYNTYEHSGLPPGPIANPGEASLEAALHPAKTDYMYFVANDQGGHFFSRTLAEHNRNIARYRHLVRGDPPPAHK